MPLRDPRIDPRPGDQLRLSCALRVDVTDNDGQRVAWIVRRPHLRDYPNSWSLAAWRNTIAKGATVLFAEAEQAYG